jgi:D-lyxose ketol-isomerase
MKRSEINRILKEGMEFIENRGFPLPPFAHWTPEEWKLKGPECRQITEVQLGWDLTDFGGKDFGRIGLLLFTLRNGPLQDGRDPFSKDYAEKILLVREEQVTPAHFHFSKMEDLINRGGGRLVLQLWNSTPEETLSHTDVEASCDGILRIVRAGGFLVLAPGESITLPPRLYHKTWGEKGHGPVLVGEVSRVNDDHADTRFFDPVGRFPEIEEDTAPFRLLRSDYPKYFPFA